METFSASALGLEVGVSWIFCFCFIAGANSIEVAGKDEGSDVLLVSSFGICSLGRTGSSQLSVPASPRLCESVSALAAFIPDSSRFCSTGCSSAEWLCAGVVGASGTSAGATFSAEGVCIAPNALFWKTSCAIATTFGCIQVALNGSTAKSAAAAPKLSANFTKNMRKPRAGSLRLFPRRHGRSTVWKTSAHASFSKPQAPPVIAHCFRGREAISPATHLKLARKSYYLGFFVLANTNEGLALPFKAALALERRQNTCIPHTFTSQEPSAAFCWGSESCAAWLLWEWISATGWQVMSHTGASMSHLFRCLFRPWSLCNLRIEQEKTWRLWWTTSAPIVASGFAPIFPGVEFSK